MRPCDCPEYGVPKQSLSSGKSAGPPRASPTSDAFLHSRSRNDTTKRLLEPHKLHSPPSSGQTSSLMSTEDLKVLWDASAAHPFEPLVGKEHHFTIGFVLLLFGFLFSSLFGLSEFSPRGGIPKAMVEEWRRWMF